MSVQKPRYGDVFRIVQGGQEHIVMVLVRDGRGPAFETVTLLDDTDFMAPGELGTAWLADDEWEFVDAPR